MSESIEKRALSWAVGAHTGTSSKAIFGVMTGNPPSDGYCYPHDGGDLERCLLLLALIPEWRARLDEMRSVGPEWAALVDHWDELDALFRTDGRAITYKRMRQLLDPIEKKRQGLFRLRSGNAIYIPGLKSWPVASRLFPPLSSPAQRPKPRP